MIEKFQPCWISALGFKINLTLMCESAKTFQIVCRLWTKSVEQVVKKWIPLGLFTLPLTYNSKLGVHRVCEIIYMKKKQVLRHYTFIKINFFSVLDLTFTLHQFSVFFQLFVYFLFLYMILIRNSCLMLQQSITVNVIILNKSSLAGLPRFWKYQISSVVWYKWTKCFIY